MRVSAFMQPADKVYTLCPTDSIHQATELMIQHHIGAIVILAMDTSSSSTPMGVITKTDLVQAYRQEIPSDRPLQDILRQPFLMTCTDTMSRDQAARILQHNHTHHAIVLDSHTHNFAGLISAWDILSECAKDDRAWPWIRPEDGRFHQKPSSSGGGGGYYSSSSSINRRGGVDGDDDDDDLLLVPTGGGRTTNSLDKQHHGKRQHGHPFSSTFERYLRDTAI